MYQTDFVLFETGFDVADANEAMEAHIHTPARGDYEPPNSPSRLIRQQNKRASPGQDRRRLERIRE